MACHRIYMTFSLFKQMLFFFIFQYCHFTYFHFYQFSWIEMRCSLMFWIHHFIFANNISNMCFYGNNVIENHENLYSLTTNEYRIHRVRVSVFSATFNFNNISVMSWQSVLLLEDNSVPRENNLHAASHWQTFIRIYITAPSTYV